MQALREVNSEMKILKRAVFDEKTHKYKEAEIRAKNVSNASQRLGRFADLVLAKIKNDGSNHSLDLSNPSAEKPNFWAALKSNFNNLLSNPMVEAPKQNNVNPIPDKRLSLKQIALLHSYLDSPITESNGNKIAKTYGWESGKKLYQHYNFYSQKQNRIHSEHTLKKTCNKRDLIQSVLLLLENYPDKIQKAKAELQTLESKIVTG